MWKEFSTPPRAQELFPSAFLKRATSARKRSYNDETRCADAPPFAHGPLGGLHPPTPIRAARPAGNAFPGLNTIVGQNPNPNPAQAAKLHPVFAIRLRSAAKRAANAGSAARRSSAMPAIAPPTCIMRTMQRARDGALKLGASQSHSTRNWHAQARHTHTFCSQPNSGAWPCDHAPRCYLNRESSRGRAHGGASRGRRSHRGQRPRSSQR